MGGTGSNDAFVVTLEDCRLCSLNWHEPKKIILHPTHVERIEVVSVGSSVEKRKRNHNHGHVNLTLDIPIRSYHTIYIDYHSRWDSDAPTRDDYNKPEHVSH